MAKNLDNSTPFDEFDDDENDYSNFSSLKIIPNN